MLLCQLADKYRCDKSPAIKHSYTPFYDGLLSARRMQIRAVLEIGVFRGASLKMWRDYFPQAHIVGVDIQPECKHVVEDERVSIQIVDNRKWKEMRQSALDISAQYDLIIDDGNHSPGSQICSVQALLPLVAPGGLFIIEDIQPNGLQLLVPGSRFRNQLDKEVEERLRGCNISLIQLHNRLDLVDDAIYLIQIPC
jgi:predicted O-methyltransferase YrrM